MVEHLAETSVDEKAASKAASTDYVSVAGRAVSTAESLAER